MLRLLHAGGMMSVDEVGLFGHRIRLLYPPEFDETGRAWGCYNYFENDFWESWGLNADKGTFSSNKLGGGAFRTAVLAGYVLTALSCRSYGIVTVGGSYVLRAPVHRLDQRRAGHAVHQPTGDAAVGDREAAAQGRLRANTTRT